jgi:antirestriction protein ArdC
MTKRSGTRATTRHDHQQEITNRILAALEAGDRPWQRPWRIEAPMLPINAITGRPYRGINLVMLAIASFASTAGDPRWCTYKQAAGRGWQVRRGEKGTTCFFYKPLLVEREGLDASQEDAGTRTIPLLRAFTVFHAGQIDGIPPFVTSAPERPITQRIEAVETILRNSKVEIRIGGNRAFYCPSTDHIQLPPDHQFDSAESRAAVAMHELGHASGAAHRLNRDLTGKFGDESYAREELRVELGSCFVGSTLGIPTDIPNHASYLASWIKVLNADRREIFRAAADAQRIADYCLGLHPDYRTQPDDAGAEADDLPAAA